LQQEKDSETCPDRYYHSVIGGSRNQSGHCFQTTDPNGLTQMLLDDIVEGNAVCIPSVSWFMYHGIRADRVWHCCSSRWSGII